VNRPSLPRRWFLGMAALFAVFGRNAGHVFAASAPRPVEIGPDLIRLLPGIGDAAVVGREYLAAHPAEADGADLLRYFRSLAGDPAALRAVIGARLRQDFADGETVRVRGWVLARTEARLCALCALLDDEARPVARAGGDDPSRG
jgi:hypothetical protein